MLLFLLTASLISSAQEVEIDNADEPVATAPDRGPAAAQPKKNIKRQTATKPAAPAKGAKPAAPAASGIPCARVAWTGRRDLAIKDLMVEFQKLGRTTITQMAFDELYKSAPDAMTMPMLHYLSVNSKGKREQDFFQALGYMVTQDWLPKDAVQQWPSRVPTRPLMMELKEVCAEYQKVIGK